MKYTVTAVTGSQDGSFVAGDGTNVELTDYQLSVTNDAGKVGNVWLSKKPSSPPPSPGEVIEGDTKPIPGGPLKGQLKLKKASNPQFQNNGGGFSGGPAQGSDDRQESIERQVSAKCAAQVVAAMVATGQGGEAQISGLTEAFYKAIQGKATTTIDMRPALATNDAPADTSQFGPPADAGPSDDDDSQIPF